MAHSRHTQSEFVTFLAQSFSELLGSKLHTSPLGGLGDDLARLPNVDRNTVHTVYRLHVRQQEVRVRRIRHLRDEM
jgi:hypothetical protein